MAPYRVEFSQRAYRQFAKVPREMQRRLAPHIDALAADPRPAHARRLVTDEELYRLRVGTYRIVYAVEDEEVLVLVVRVGHRRDVYRDL